MRSNIYDPKGNAYKKMKWKLKSLCKYILTVLHLNRSTEIFKLGMNISDLIIDLFSNSGSCHSCCPIISSVHTVMDVLKLLMLLPPSLSPSVTVSQRLRDMSLNNNIFHLIFPYHFLN